MSLPSLTKLDMSGNQESTPEIEACDAGYAEGGATR